MTERLPFIIPGPQALACRNCDAWSRYGEIKVVQEAPGGLRSIGLKTLGLCRANPPTINPEAISGDTAAWPVVGADDWCREHRRYRGERGEAA